MPPFEKTTPKWARGGQGVDAQDGGLAGNDGLVRPVNPPLPVGSEAERLDEFEPFNDSGECQRPFTGWFSRIFRAGCDREEKAKRREKGDRGKPEARAEPRLSSDAGATLRS
jgi:hypothetical protein